MLLLSTIAGCSARPISATRIHRKFSLDRGKCPRYSLFDGERGSVRVEASQHWREATGFTVLGKKFGCSFSSYEGGSPRLVGNRTFENQFPRNFRFAGHTLGIAVSAGF